MKISAAGGTRPLRVAAFTGGAAVPSARFRLRQYLPHLAQEGIAVREMRPRLGAYPPARRWLRPLWLAGTLAERLAEVAAAWPSDVTFLQREMVSTLATLEGVTPRPRLLDIDDAIHLFREGRPARRLAALADLVVVGNAWLAEVWRAWTPRLEILPTAVDCAAYPLAPAPERPVIGWIGTRSNLPYLESLAEPLAEVVRRFPNLKIAVCSDRAPELPRLPVIFTPWHLGIEPAFLVGLTVGLMPLKDGPWERGKCSFKMLQYLAAGRPCVVSPVGMNAEILAQAEVGFGADRPDQWVAALSALLADPDHAVGLGAAGRALVEQHYSLQALAPRLAALLRCLT